MLSKDPNEEKGDIETPALTEREAEVERLRKLSLKPGGFGEERLLAWSFLLHAQDVALEKLGLPVAEHERRRRSSKTLQSESDFVEKTELRSSSPDEHPDEHQIKLDTDRSFVLYPVGHDNREELQEDLNRLITTIFRRHPSLSYFQGYHDIITVLFLTLPEEQQLRCAERFSLHRLRDAMGKSLEPLIGQLRILKYLLRLADGEYAELLERNTPLPYFALSNLLTLFSHDVPTLPLIQHIFDYLLCRPPLASVYLAAAFTLAQKDFAKQLEEDDEEGMLHSLLSTLPELDDEVMADVDSVPVRCEDGLGDRTPAVRLTGRHTKAENDLDTDREKENSRTVMTGTLDIPIISDQLKECFKEEPDSGMTLQPSISATSERIDIQPEAIDVINNIEPSPKDSDGHSDSSTSRSSSPSPDFPQQIRKRKQAVSLSKILAEADALYEQFPPSLPSLHLSDIIGPNSVISTWTDDPSQLLSDAEAEALVAHPELVIKPYVDPDDLPHSKEGDDSDQYDSEHPPKKGRRKLRKRHPLHFGVPLDRKTVLTGAVVALGVAVAVYSMRARLGNGHNSYSFNDIARLQGGVRKVCGWVSGAVIGGGSGRLLGNFAW